MEFEKFAHYFDLEFEKFAHHFDEEIYERNLSWKFTRPQITQEEDLMTNSNTLYKATVNEIEQYVTLIGRDGSNYVVKVSSTNEILAVKTIEEVLPDTIEIHFFGGVAKSYAYLVKDLSCFMEGDILIPDDSTSVLSPKLAIVTGVDTKSKQATKYFKGRIVVTKAV